MRRLLLLPMLLFAANPAMAAYGFLTPRAMDATLKCLETQRLMDCKAAERALTGLQDYANSKNNVDCILALITPAIETGQLSIPALAGTLTDKARIEVYEDLEKMQATCK